MTNSPDNKDPYLADAARIAAVQYELIPWLTGLWQPQELAFRPLPEEMLRILESSPDFTMPDAGKPTILNFAAENGEGGMLVVLHPTTNVLYAMVPVG